METTKARSYPVHTLDGVRTNYRVFYSGTAWHYEPNDYEDWGFSPPFKTRKAAYAAALRWIAEESANEDEQDHRDRSHQQALDSNEVQ